MVNRLTLPFSALNQVPGIGGIEDRTVELLEPADIQEELEAAVPSLEDIREEVEAGLLEVLEEGGLIDDLVGDVADTVVREVEEATGLDFPEPEEIAEAVADRIDIPDFDGLTVDIEGSLFDVEQDFVDLLVAALEQADLLEVSQVPTLGEISDLLEEATADLEELELPTADELQDDLADALEETLDDILPDYLTLSLEELITEVGEVLEERLLSEETEEALREASQER